MLSPDDIDMAAEEVKLEVTGVRSSPVCYQNIVILSDEQRTGIYSLWVSPDRGECGSETYS